MSMRSQDRHTGPRARTVRGIDDALWQAAREKAAAQGSSLSGVIVALLTRWVRPAEPLTRPQRLPGESSTVALHGSQARAGGREGGAGA